MTMDKQARYIDYLVKLAAQNPCEGIVEEPRAFYDVVRMATTTARPVRSNEGVFFNGEKYPILLTHMLAFLRPSYDLTPVVGEDEALIQRVGMRLVFDDSFYENAQFQALPLWHNVVATGNPSIQRAHASFTLDRPLILASRNSLDVRVNLALTPGSPRRAEVAFRGVGLMSQQPLVLSAFADLDDEGTVQLSPEGFRNLRAEPVALTDMSVMLSAENLEPADVGDLRLLNVNIRTIGGGTQSDFYQGPSDPPFPRMPAYLLGKTTGRCITHRFPGDGVRLEPGQSFYAELLPLTTDVENLDVALAFHGSIFVT